MKHCFLCNDKAEKFYTYYDKNDDIERYHLCPEHGDMFFYTHKQKYNVNFRSLVSYPITDRR